MKKIKFVILLAVLLCSFVPVFSQEKVITQEEYSSAISKGVPDNEKTAYRITALTNFYNGDKLSSKRTLITENLPPNKKRTVFSIEEAGSLAERTEIITIGTIRYTKKDDNKWEKIDLANSNFLARRLGGVTTKKSETQDCLEFFVTNTTIDGQPVSIYLSYRVFTMDRILYFIEDRHWMNKDGLIMKSTTKVSNKLPENITSTVTRDYSYNPSTFAINAPDLD